LEGLLWIGNNQARTNEPLTFWLPTLIDALEQWFDDENYVHPSSEHHQAVKAGIRSLRAVGNDCRSGRQNL
jgi:hypothetical protein